MKSAAAVTFRQTDNLSAKRIRYIRQADRLSGRNRILCAMCIRHALWTVAQALSEILPEGDKEKQMLQGLLASKERVVTEVWQGRLFD